MFLAQIFEFIIFWNKQDNEFLQKNFTIIWSILQSKHCDDLIDNKHIYHQQVLTV